MAMTRVSAAKLQGNLSDTLKTVSEGERVVIRRGKKDIAAIVPIADLEALEAMEDRIDAEEAEKSLNEPGENIAWEDVKKRLVI
jgi:prevent-host-death family protein